MLKKWMSLTSLMALLIISGCQTQNNKGSNDLRNDNAAHNMSVRGKDGDGPDSISDRGKNKKHLVEDDITNQNPNFLDLNRTGSGGEAGANNHGNDINKAKQVIAGTNEFTTDSVWINGDRMWVTVYKKGTQSNNDKNNEEARLHRKLVQALPRYHIEVRVKDKNR
jgi:hypothetical protein